MGMARKPIRRVCGALAITAAMAVALPAAPASAGGGCHRGATVTEATGTAVEMKEACFTPTVLHVKSGDTVTWTNLDRMDHVVAGQGWGHFDNMGGGAVTSYRFTKAGVYPYTCFLHPGMNGAVVVGQVKAPKEATTSEAVVSDVAHTPSPPAARLPVKERPLAQPVVAASSSTPWKIATGVGFGLFAVTLGSLAVARRPGRKASPVVA
jgi:plastocyanin